MQFPRINSTFGDQAARWKIDPAMSFDSVPPLFRFHSPVVHPSSSIFTLSSFFLFPSLHERSRAKQNSHNAFVETLVSSRYYPDGRGREEGGFESDSKLILRVGWHTFEWTITLPQLTTIVRDRDEKGEGNSGRGRERKVSRGGEGR